MSNFWIGVDLDGTLARYEGWKGPDHIGAPIPKMVERVKLWLSMGITVKIFTARVAKSGWANKEGFLDDAAFAAQQESLIKHWCVKVFGRELEVTATKDLHMTQLWDDIAVPVIPNTGEIRGLRKLSINEETGIISS
jgi:hypothetical protein